MADRVTVTAIVGSYRKGGMVDQAVDHLLAAAAEAGGVVKKIYLVDTQIEFCTNCRLCTQSEGAARGICRIADQMSNLLVELEASDAIVLASSVNFGTVTAVMKRFIERLVCYAYWPWGRPAPKVRKSQLFRNAVVVASSAAPAFLARFMTPVVKLLKQAAGLLGARTVGVLFVGLAARDERQELAAAVKKRAGVLGKKLVASSRR